MIPWRKNRTFRASSTATDLPTYDTLSCCAYLVMWLSECRVCFFCTGVESYTRSRLIMVVGTVAKGLLVELSYHIPRDMFLPCLCHVRTPHQRRCCRRPSCTTCDIPNKQGKNTFRYERYESTTGANVMAPVFQLTWTTSSKQFVSPCAAVLSATNHRIRSAQRKLLGPWRNS